MVGRVAETEADCRGSSASNEEMAGILLREFLRYGGVAVCGGEGARGVYTFDGGAEGEGGVVWERGDGWGGCDLDTRVLGTKKNNRLGPRMNANTREWEMLDELVERVVGAVYEVANVLGAGFLEKVYERALVRELGLRGLRVKSQAAFPVGYSGLLWS